VRQPSVRRPNRPSQSKQQFLQAITNSKEFVRIAVTPNNRQKYFNLLNSLKKFSKLRKNAPKAQLNAFGKNIYNKYSVLPGQSGLGYMNKLKALGKVVDIVSIYSRPHANGLQEGILLGATARLPVGARLTRSVARSLIPRSRV
jgi:hypothetical protein